MDYEMAVGIWRQIRASMLSDLRKDRKRPANLSITHIFGQRQLALSDDRAFSSAFRLFDQFRWNRLSGVISIPFVGKSPSCR